MMRRGPHRMVLGLLVAFAAAPGLARELTSVAGPFPAVSTLSLDCLLDRSESEGWFPEPKRIALVWDLDRAEARAPDQPAQATAPLVEIPGFAWRDGLRFVAHFRLADPAPETLSDPRLSTALFSVRSDGDAVLTEHSVVYGGMRALTQSGRCTFAPVATGD